MDNFDFFRSSGVNPLLYSDKVSTKLSDGIQFIDFEPVVEVELDSIEEKFILVRWLCASKEKCNIGLDQLFIETNCINNFLKTSNIEKPLSSIKKKVEVLVNKLSQFGDPITNHIKKQLQKNKKKFSSKNSEAYDHFCSLIEQLNRFKNKNDSNVKAKWEGVLNKKFDAKDLKCVTLIPLRWRCAILEGNGYKPQQLFTDTKIMCDYLNENKENPTKKVMTVVNSLIKGFSKFNDQEIKKLRKWSFDKGLYNDLYRFIELLNSYEEKILPNFFALKCIWGDDFESETFQKDAEKNLTLLMKKLDLIQLNQRNN